MPRTFESRVKDQQDLTHFLDKLSLDAQTFINFGIEKIDDLNDPDIGSDYILLNEVLL
jgi:hypothetical protein